MLKSLFVPGGVLLLIAVALLQVGLLPISAAAVSFYYFAAFAAGALLAWRFHSSRVLFALIFIFLAHRALEFFSAGHPVASGPGRMSQALGITRERDNNKDLTSRASDLWLADDGFVPEQILATPRIGITKAMDRPLRFSIAGNAYVSGKKL